MRSPYAPAVGVSIPAAGRPGGQRVDGFGDVPATRTTVACLDALVVAADGGPWLLFGIVFVGVFPLGAAPLTTGPCSGGVSRLDRDAGLVR